MPLTLIKSSLPMFEVVGDSLVEVVLDNDRLWVNVDGICRLRASRLDSDIVLTGNHTDIHRPRRSMRKADSDV